MADYKIVNAEQLDSDLTSIADSIRAQTGNNVQLIFPQGFKEQIDSLSFPGNLSDYMEGKTDDVSTGDIKVIRGRCFYNHNNMKSINMPHVEEIMEYAFYWCSNLSIVVLSDCLKMIQYGAFIACSSLKTMTFKNKPNYLNSPFSSDIEIINVPWAEGEVPNAPWGATNATINYNYTEG